MDSSMQSNFFVDSHTNGRAITLTMSGELDLVSAPVLEQALRQVAEPDVELIILDLRGLAFMDSTGLHLLIQAQQHAHDSGRSLAVVRGSEQVQRLLDVTGVGDALTLVDSPEELLEVDPAPGAP
jgi:anti-sigma B factor antagonist